MEKQLTTYAGLLYAESPSPFSYVLNVGTSALVYLYGCFDSRVTGLQNIAYNTWTLECIPATPILLLREQCTYLGLLINEMLALRDETRGLILTQLCYFNSVLTRLFKHYMICFLHDFYVE